MPRPFPAEFRRRAVALVRAGKPIATAAVELGVSAAAIHNWVRQDQIDQGERPGIATPESIELAKAKKRIRQLEEELVILRKASKLFGEDRPGPKYKKRPLSPTRMRRRWLTGLIREVHIASRQTYGSRRVHAELTLGMGAKVSERLVAVLMSEAKIAGLPGRAKVKRLHGIATADDLVHRKFHRLAPNELWVTDITEHPTREGWPVDDVDPRESKARSRSGRLASALMPVLRAVGDSHAAV